MKQLLFIGMASIVFFASAIWLLGTAVLAQPAGYIEIPIAFLIIANIIFSFEEDWGLGSFLVSLFLTALVIPVIGLVHEMINASVQFSKIHTFTPTILVNGIRWLSLIWPFAVLIIGMKNYLEKPLKEKAKQEEPEGEEAKKQ
jgi:hypothetical protein